MKTKTIEEKCLKCAWDLLNIRQSIYPITFGLLKFKKEPSGIIIKEEDNTALHHTKAVMKITEACNLNYYVTFKNNTLQHYIF